MISNQYLVVIVLLSLLSLELTISSQCYRSGLDLVQKCFFCSFLIKTLEYFLHHKQNKFRISIYQSKYNQLLPNTPYSATGFVYPHTLQTYSQIQSHSSKTQYTITTHIIYTYYYQPPKQPQTIKHPLQLLKLGFILYILLDSFVCIHQNQQIPIHQLLKFTHIHSYSQIPISKPNQPPSTYYQLYRNLQLKITQHQIYNNLMFNHLPSTKSQTSPQVIQFSDIDDKSLSSSPYSKMPKTKQHPIPSFGMISQNPYIDLPTLSSSQDAEILLVHCSHNTLCLNDDPIIDKLLSSQRMKFVVEVSVSRAVSQCITIIQKPIFSDSSQCKYYILRCYLNNQQTPMSFYLARFIYSIAVYFCLAQINQKIISFLNIALKNMKPPLWKTNNLLVGTNEQDEPSTTYQTTTNHQSIFKSSDAKHETSTHASRMTEKACRTRIIDIKHQMLNYFTNISTLKFQGKIQAILNQSRPKTLYYQLKDLTILVQKINTNTLLLHDFQADILKGNMQDKVTQCKKQYITLCNTVYNTGKSLQFVKLRALLTEMYSAVIDSFDRQFQVSQGLQDYDIHRSILRRWVETQQEQIFEVNSILHESQTTKIIQISIGKGSQLQANIQSFFEKNKDRKLQGTNLDALSQFLKSTYMESIKRKVQSIQISNKKRIVRQINYYSNPAEMLKNCQQRLNLCNDKKQYLHKCIDLVEKQIQNLDNLYNGLSLQEQRQSMRYQNLNQTKGNETHDKFKSTYVSS